MKQRSVATVANIVFLGINAIEMSHTPGQISLRGLEQQMVMGWHQTIGCHFNIEQICGLLQQINKLLIIRLGNEKILPPSGTIYPPLSLPN
jgi:hypothetical protein